MPSVYKSLCLSDAYPGTQGDCKENPMCWGQLHKEGDLWHYFFLEIFGSIKNSSYFCSKKSIKLEKMEPKIGDKMKVSPQLTAQPDWIDGEVIDVEHNPFIGLVISIKDKLGRIFFGQSRFFVAL